MKKNLFTLLFAVSMVAAIAQPMPSPNWNIIQNASFSITSAGVRYMDAVDPNTVWLTGYDGFATNRNYNWFSKTTDGGNSYTSGNVFADTNTYRIGNIEGIDGNTAWVSAFLKPSGDKGSIFKTTDGGATWIDMASPTMYTVSGGSFVNFVTFLTPSVGLVQGDPINMGGSMEFEMYRTIDGGATWSVVPGDNIPNPLAGEYGTINVYTKQGNNNFWFGTNKNRIYRSTDAGVTWSVSALPTNTMGAARLVDDLAFVDANNGLVSAYWGPAGATTLTLYQTTDGGATWVQIPNIDPNFGRNDFCSIEGTSWYASCGNGAGNQVISFSSDFGVTWNSWGGSGIGYLAMDFVNPSTGWVGSFSSQTLATQGGIYKYSGPSLFIPAAANANFSISPAACNGVAMTVTNSSTGAPLPTYTWSSNPAASISNSNAINPNFTFSVNQNYTITLSANNGGTTSTTSKTVEVTTCVGINENTFVGRDINVFPNPSSDKINIEIAGLDLYQYQVTDLLGKVVLKDTVANQDRITLDVSNLNKGIYLLVIESNGQKATRKLVVE
jgi:photosystem II stability/assembly factor-like uncharacterized protein